MNVYTISRGSACINVYAESQQQASTWCSHLRLSLCQICYPILNLADVERADCMEKIRKKNMRNKSLPPYYLKEEIARMFYGQPTRMLIE